MPGEGHASPYLAEFAPHERQGRVEPETRSINGAWDGLCHRYVRFSLRCRTVGRGARDRHRAAAVWIGPPRSTADLGGQPRCAGDHTVVAAGPVSPGEEEAVSTAKATSSPGDPPATIVTSAGTAPVSDPTSHAPDPVLSPPQMNSSAAAEFAGPGAPTRSASGGSRSRAHSVTHRDRSTHHYQQPPAQAEKQRVLSAAMDRAHRENFS